MWQPLGLLHDQALRIHIVKFEISLLYCVRVKLQTHRGQFQILCFIDRCIKRIEQITNL